MLLESGHRSILAWQCMLEICCLRVSRSMIRLVYTQTSSLLFYQMLCVRVSNPTLILTTFCFYCRENALNSIFPPRIFSQLIVIYMLNCSYNSESRGAFNKKYTTSLSFEVTFAFGERCAKYILYTDCTCIFMMHCNGIAN